jgi:hypothetical protein
MPSLVMGVACAANGLEAVSERRSRFWLDTSHVAATYAKRQDSEARWELIGCFSAVLSATALHPGSAGNT